MSLVKYVEILKLVRTVNLLVNVIHTLNVCEKFQFNGAVS